MSSLRSGLWDRALWAGSLLVNVLRINTCGGVKTVGMDKGRSRMNSEALATETSASPLDCSAAEILFRAPRLAGQTFILLHGQIL